MASQNIWGGHRGDAQWVSDISENYVYGRIANDS